MRDARLELWGFSHDRVGREGVRSWPIRRKAIRRARITMWSFFKPPGDLTRFCWWIGDEGLDLRGREW